MGDEGILLVKKWTAIGKLDFSLPEEISAGKKRRQPFLSGFILQTYWDLLDVECKPKGNKLLSIIELWTQSKQATKTLNE